MKKLIFTFILATLCGISAFAQDFLQVNASLSKDNISLNMPKSNSQRNGESAIWSCTFEESTPRYTTGQLTASEGNWELQTKSDFYGENDYWALNSTSDAHPHGDYTDTPEHWMMIDPGNGYQQGFDFDSYILFTGIDLTGATYPQVCFYEYRQIFNITPSMEGTVLEYSLNGGATWTKKVVGCESQSEEGFYYRRVPIFEAGGYNNVMIRFRAKRSESLIQSTFGPSATYSVALFIVHWQIDDVVIEEAAPFDFVITDYRMNKGECNIYSDQAYASQLGVYQPRYYQYSPMYGMTPRSEWESGNMFASFNVAVENRGYETVVPNVNITITGPNGEEIWTVDFQGDAVSSYSLDTIDVIEYLSNNRFDKVFKFTEEQMQNIATGEYTVTYTVTTEAGDDPTPANNVASHPFYITEKAYCPATPNLTKTMGPNNWSGFVEGGEILAGFDYYVLPDEALPVYVFISDNTTPGTAIAANIYEYNAESDDFELTITSGTYTITEADLGNWVNIAFETPLILDEFDAGSESKTIYVGIAFFENGEDNTLKLGASSDMPNKGWICRYNLGDGIKAINAASDSDAPAICLGNPNPETITTYTIDVLSANETMGYVSGGGTFSAGAIRTISATPYSGYRFVRWNDGNTSNPRTITVTGDAIYIASFEALPEQYTITVLSANETMGYVSGGGIFYDGDQVSISATPYSGYRFVRWNDGNTRNTRTITVTGDATYIASFEAMPEHSAIWACTFEEETPIYTTGQLIASDGNWELQTKSDFYGENYYWALNSTSDAHPRGDYTDTPEHWMMIDPGNGRGAGFDFDSYILFTGIDLTGTTNPQVCFYEYRQIFNITPSMEGTVLEYSLNGGATWTTKVVGCEAQSEAGFAYKRVPIFEAAGNDNVMIRFRAKRSQDLITSTFGPTATYSAGQFIVHWQVDDVIIEEAQAFDLVITDYRMNKGRCDLYSNPETIAAGYTSSHYQLNPIFGQTPRSEWTSENMFASFNVAVENRGSENVVPIVNITITGPNGEEIWRVNFEGDVVGAYERDTIDVIEIQDNNQVDKVFKFTEEQMQNIATGEYTVTYTVSTEAGADPTPANNTASHHFYITEKAYCPATPNITSKIGPNNWTSFEDGDEILAGFEYNILPDEALPVYVFISDNTTPGTAIAAYIYEYNAESADYELTLNSGTYTITEADLGNWVNIAFETPLILDEFDSGSNTKFVYVGIAFYENGADNTLQLGASSDMPNKGWICRYNLGDGIKTINVTSNSNAPAICLGDPNAETISTTTYTIDVLSANESMGYASGGGTFSSGARITISATPYTGYRFVRWNDGNTSNPRTITVTGNATYIASFEAMPEQYTITVLSANETMGYVSGGGTFYDGDQVSISATPLVQ